MGAQRERERERERDTLEQRVEDVAQLGSNEHEQKEIRWHCFVFVIMMIGGAWEQHILALGGELLFMDCCCFPDAGDEGLASGFTTFPGLIRLLLTAALPLFFTMLFWQWLEIEEEEESRGVLLPATIAVIILGGGGGGA